MLKIKLLKKNTLNLPQYVFDIEGLLHVLCLELVQERLC